jgi:hypothetical protein
MTYLDPILGGAIQPGGDLAPSGDNQVVIGIRGRPVGAGAPSANDAYVWNGSSWVATNLLTAWFASLTDLSLSGRISAGGALTGGSLHLGTDGQVVQATNGPITGRVEPAAPMTSELRGIVPVLEVTGNALLGSVRATFELDRIHESSTAGTKTQDFNVSMYDGVTLLGDYHALLTIDCELGLQNHNPISPYDARNYGACRRTATYQYSAVTGHLTKCGDSAVVELGLSANTYTLQLLTSDDYSDVRVLWTHPASLDDDICHWSINLTVKITREPLQPNGDP